MITCNICGREFDKQGSLNLHKYHCKVKQYRQSEPGGKQIIQQQDNETCVHEWRLLSQAGREGMAYRAGYREVCGKCQNLR